MENMIANFAQFDNDMRAERCSNGMKDAIRAGRYVWNAPVGLDNSVVAGKSDIQPNDMAPLVRRAFELVAIGQQSTDEVRRIMIKEGLRTKSGKPISKGYFHAMLRNELYAGWITQFGERNRANYGQVIPDGLFTRVQIALKSRGHFVADYKTDNPDFPLRRFVFSPDGLRLTGSWSRGRSGTKYAFYRFGAKGSNYQRDGMEAKFTAFMDSFAFDTKHVSKLKQRIKEKFEEATQDERTQSRKMENRLQEIARACLPSLENFTPPSHRACKMVR